MHRMIIKVIRHFKFFRCKGCWEGSHYNYISRGLAAQRAAARSPMLIGKKRKPMNGFSHGYLMANGYACGRLRTVATAMTMTESCKMAPILQLIGRQRYAALVYGVLL